MFCAEPFLGSLLILCINIKSGMSIHSSLDYCCVIQLPCLAHCRSLITCTVTVLSKVKRSPGEDLALFGSIFSSRGRQTNSCPNSCIPAAATREKAGPAQRTGFLLSLPAYFQHFTAPQGEHLSLCCLLSSWSSTVFRKPT